MTGERGLLDVLLLQDYNTTIVVLGTAALGLAAGFAGTLLLLRKRALLGDVVSHAMLPGVVAAFLVMRAFDGSGKSLIGLLIGATISGLAAAWLVPALRRASGLKEDAVMGIVLGGTFGLGIALMGIALNTPGGNQAGLESFIFGKTATIHSHTITANSIATVTIIKVKITTGKYYTVGAIITVTITNPT